MCCEDSRCFVQGLGVSHVWIFLDCLRNGTLQDMIQDAALDHDAIERIAVGPFRPVPGNTQDDIVSDETKILLRHTMQQRDSITEFEGQVAHLEEQVLSGFQALMPSADAGVHVSAASMHAEVLFAIISCADGKKPRYPGSYFSIIGVLICSVLCLLCAL